MGNILLQYCRLTNGYSNLKVAAHLGISENEYLNIEKGNTLLDRQQAILLSNLFNIEPVYFLKEAVQLELLNSQAELIKVLRGEILRLRNEAQPPFIINTYQLN
jgi:transcriptional regulator with XRE-family HTH domain